MSASTVAASTRQQEAAEQALADVHYAGSARPAEAAMRVLGDVHAVVAIPLDDEKVPA
jgi:hypothetical protein